MHRDGAPSGREAAAFTCLYVTTPTNVMPPGSRPNGRVQPNWPDTRVLGRPGCLPNWEGPSSVATRWLGRPLRGESTDPGEHGDKARETPIGASGGGVERGWSPCVPRPGGCPGTGRPPAAKRPPLLVYMSQQQQT